MDYSQVNLVFWTTGLHSIGGSATISKTFRVNLDIIFFGEMCLGSSNQTCIPLKSHHSCGEDQKELFLGQNCIMGR